MYYEDDGLNFARGVVYAVLPSLAIWAGIIWIVWRWRS